MIKISDIQSNTFFINLTSYTSIITRVFCIYERYMNRFVIDYEKVITSIIKK